MRTIPSNLAWLSLSVIKTPRRTHARREENEADMEIINVEWNGNLKVPPCKTENDCPYRSATCHGRCKGYKEYRDAKDAEARKRKALCAGIYSTHDRVIVNEHMKRNAKKGGVKSI